MTALAPTTPPTPNKAQSSSESFKITMEHFKRKNIEEVIKAVQDGYRDDVELNLPPARQSKSEENIHKSGSMICNSTLMSKKYEVVEQQLQQEQAQVINPEDLKKLSMEQIRAKVTDAGSIGEDADFGKASRSGSECQMKELNKLVMMLPVAQSYMEAEKKLDEKDKSKKSDGKEEKKIATKSPTSANIPRLSDRAKKPPSL
ncbi:unnamed protein product, partial [Mesorhabditis belari]|uniref:Uncharacterized protein n=1 Tax=Mesorhabditis belari TaxID=2138241 RepID=A0AAF3F3D7_9BILA